MRRQHESRKLEQISHLKCFTCRVHRTRSATARMASRNFLRSDSDSIGTSSMRADGKGFITILASGAKNTSRAVSRQTSTIHPFDSMKLTVKS